MREVGGQNLLTSDVISHLVEQEPFKRALHLCRLTDKFAKTFLDAVRATIRQGLEQVQEKYEHLKEVSSPTDLLDDSATR